MVVVAPDFVDTAVSESSRAGSEFNRPAIHHVISEAELKRRFSLYQGSGGVPAYGITMPPSGAQTQFNVNVITHLSSELEEIRSVFQLSMTQLAEVCGVQRKTLYNWKDGETSPHAASMKRLYQLLVCARDWKSEGYKLSKAQLLEPVISDESLFDILKAEHFSSDKVLFAGSRLNISPRKLTDPFA
jgi:transcriptional regulator with XRE-family HTH domain